MFNMETIDRIGTHFDLSVLQCDNVKFMSYKQD
jgi:hypothetical protein